MIIAKAPLRISLFGGGTDRPSYYTKHGSTIISAAIDLYIYVTYSARQTGGHRLTYSQVEELPSLFDAEHTIVQAVSRFYGLQTPCTLSIVGDMPKGTGLGSSSALCVALCRIFDNLNGIDLARRAFEIEATVSPVGVQDHLAAACGGFRVYEINDVVHARGLKRRELLDECGVLLYTGQTREANGVLKNWSDTYVLHEINAIAEFMADEIDTADVSTIAQALKDSWSVKAKIPGVCTEGMAAQYSQAMNSGAWAGKLLGAGGGGCWFFLAPPDCHESLASALGLQKIAFKVAGGVELSCV